MGWRVIGILLALLAGFEIAWGALGFVWFGATATTLILAPLFMFVGLVGLFLAYEMVTEG